VEQAGYQAAAGAVAASMILMEPEETTAELRAAARKREAEAR
jgi:anthranilate/para-aminobenzoate synthase component I